MVEYLDDVSTTAVLRLIPRVASRTNQLHTMKKGGLFHVDTRKKRLLYF